MYFYMLIVKLLFVSKNCSLKWKPAKVFINWQIWHKKMFPKKNVVLNEKFRYEEMHRPPDPDEPIRPSGPGRDTLVSQHSNTSFFVTSWASFWVEEEKKKHSFFILPTRKSSGFLLTKTLFSGGSERQKIQCGEYWMAFTNLRVLWTWVLWGLWILFHWSTE